jgi:LacI family transcriptional regulator
MPMRKRATIQDLAAAAGVSVATVDRVLNRRLPVREATAVRVVAAAEQIGYHATGLLKQRLAEVPSCSLGFLLQKRSNDFYRAMGERLLEAARAERSVRARCSIEFLDEIAPSAIASRISELGQRMDALAIVAVDHPLVVEAVEALTAGGKPVFTLLSELTTPAVAGHVGVDNRKAGRTAAWAISRLAKRPGKIGILLGSHRYLNQETAEISFRSYMRENAPEFLLLEPIVNLDDDRIAYEAVTHMVASNPDLVGIYMSGGGMPGLVQALRDEKAGDRIVAVCNELIPATRSALIDGTVDMALATPLTALAEKVVSAMAARVSSGRSEQGRSAFLLPAEIYIPENI